MSNNTFEGYYFKHQKDDKTVCFIPGRSNNTAFVQVITNDWSENYTFDRIDMGAQILIGNCEFSQRGMKINLPNISGEVQYSDTVPIKYDIMGPFKYFPMECRHGIISMWHKLTGCITIKGEVFDFTNGIGYIEKDSGRSFPKQYLWLQCNNFSVKSSIMLSIAHIPFFGISFMGCICAIIHDNKEYHFATYLGVNIEKLNEHKVVLKQGKYYLEIDLEGQNGHKLYAPKNGQMNIIIKECNNAKARFRFYVKGELLFDLMSNNVGFEYHF